MGREQNQSGNYLLFFTTGLTILCAIDILLYCADALDIPFG
jgi:hypothetical protein